MPFGVKSDPSFCAQKQRIRVRVSSFGTAGTVVFQGPQKQNVISMVIENADAAPPHLKDLLRLCVSLGVHGSLQFFALGLLSLLSSSFRKFCLRLDCSV